MHILFICKNKFLQPITLIFLWLTTIIEMRNTNQENKKETEILQPTALNFFKWQHHGTEELAHLEMVGAIVHQLTKDATIEEIEKAGLSAYYTDHGVGL